MTHEELARESALTALRNQNPRFALYRQQDQFFRENEVKFWTDVILLAIKKALNDPPR